MVIMNTTDRPEQLTLLTTAELPVQFRLDEATRRRGLTHINQIRLQLDEARGRRKMAATGRHGAPATPIRPARRERPRAA